MLWWAYEESYRDRLRTLDHHPGVDTLPILTSFRPPKLDSETGIAALKAAIRKHKPLLVVIDCLVPAYLDPDFEHAGPARQKLQSLKEVAEDTGVAIIVIHHLNKSHGSSKYSSDPISCSHQLAAAASSHWIMRAFGHQADGSRSIRLTVSGREFGQKEIHVASSGPATFDVTHRASPRRTKGSPKIDARILSHLRCRPYGSLQDEMVKELRCSRAAVSKALTKLGSVGVVEVVAAGRSKLYRLRESQSDM